MGCCQFVKIETGEIRISPIHSITNTRLNLDEENDDFQDISINSHKDSLDKVMITDDLLTTDHPTLATLRCEILNQLRPRSISNPTLFHGLHSPSLLISKILIKSRTPRTQVTTKAPFRSPAEENEIRKHKRSATFSFERHDGMADILENIKSNCKTLSFKHNREIFPYRYE